MSASAPDPRPFTGDQARFITGLFDVDQLCPPHADDAPHDSAEQAAGEWAERYLRLVQSLHAVLNTTAWDDWDSPLFLRINTIVEQQSSHAASAAARLGRTHA